VVPIDTKSSYEKLAKLNTTKIEKKLKVETIPPSSAPKCIPKLLWIPPDICKPSVIKIRSISGTIVNTIYKKYSDYKFFTITI
jgi:hypothetical protein